MDNKELIFSTALRLFSEKGYEAVGVQQIAQEANITKPTLYHYYQSKKGLLQEILSNLGNRYLETLHKAADYSHDVMNTLKRVATAQWEFYNNQKEFYTFYKSLCHMPLESESFACVKEYLEQEYKIFRDLFYQVSLDHGNIRERYIVYAATFMGMLATYVQVSATGIEYKNEDLLHRIVHQYMYGIFS